MKARKLLPVTMLFCAVSCTTSRPTVDTLLDSKGAVGSSAIGFNSENEAILQTETHADEELRAQIWVNNNLENEAKQVRYQLQRCRDDLSDPRLGGSGFADSLPEMIESENPAKETIGVDEKGDYKVVQKEGFVNRLKRARDYDGRLRKITKLMKKLNRQCSQKMRIARMKRGLPPERYQAKGYFTAQGTWVLTHPGEESLDDAFAMLAKLNAQNSANQ